MLLSILMRLMRIVALLPYTVEPYVAMLSLKFIKSESPRLANTVNVLSMATADARDPSSDSKTLLSSREKLLIRLGS